MPIAIICTFAPGAFARAKELRLEHYAFLRDRKASIIEGGPLLGADHVPAGMLMIVDKPDLASAKDFIAGEPYNANGFFESVQLRAWTHVIPEPEQGYIEAQYKMELSNRR